MVVSVGAGIEEKFVTKHSSDISWTSLLEMLPNGIATGVKTLLQMSSSTLDCERQWTEFTNIGIPSPELSSRYQRLNVVLPWKPCKLDDVSAMQYLKPAAAAFMSSGCPQTYDTRYGNCAAQLQFVADRLIASLFYFIVQDMKEVPGSALEWYVSGRLCCRLGLDLKTQLEALLDGNHRGQCIFRIRSQAGLVTDLNLRKRDWDLNKFAVETEFTIDNRHKNIYIETAFEKEGRWNVISGFPRLFEVCN